MKPIIPTKKCKITLNKNFNYPQHGLNTNTLDIENLSISKKSIYLQSDIIHS